MIDTRFRRRLVTALAAAAAAGCDAGTQAPAPASPPAPPPVVATLPKSDPPAASGRPRHPKDLRFEEQAFTYPRTDRVVLSNGMVLHLLEDHSLPLVDASALFRGGSVFDPPGKEGLASIACGMVRTGGTRTLPAARLDEELDLIAGSVSVGADQENLAAGFSFLSRDLDRGIGLFADVLRNPAFDDGRFAQVKASSAQGILRSLQNPGGVLGRAFNSLTHPGHPYGNLSSPASLGSLTRDDLESFHRRWFHPESFVLAVAGDFRKDDLIARLEKSFEGWEKAAEPLPKWPAPYERKYPGGHFVMAMPAVTQTHVRLGHWGPPQNTVDRVHFDVMNLVLGGGSFWSRMTKVVRTKEGLAYSVGSGLTRASQGGVFQASTETKASTTYRAVTLMKGLVREIREAPVTSEELSQAKEFLLNGAVRLIENPAALANQVATLEFKEYPGGWLEKYRDIVRATTVEDVQRVAKEYLRPDGLTLVVVGDPAGFDAAPGDLGPAQSIPPR